jgi:hypothetical protein
MITVSIDTGATTSVNQSAPSSKVLKEYASKHYEVRLLGHAKLRH